MSELLNEMTGKQVVADTDTRIAYVGELHRIDDFFLELTNVSIYDDKVIRVSLEEFLVEGVKNEFPISRGKTLLQRSRVLAVSLLEEIIEV